MDTTPPGPGTAAPSDPFKARQARDILGYVPHALGFIPTESAVLLPLAGRRVGATLRLDLPQRRDAETLNSFAGAAAGYLRRHRAADGSLLLVYTAAGWDGGPPGYGLVAHPLRAALAGAGLPVRDGWAVGPRFWRGLYCTDPACCPDPGHSIERIADSALNAEMVYRGSRVAASPEAALCLPAAPDWDPHRLREDTAGYAGRFAGWWTHPHTFRRTLSRWEGQLADRGQPDQQTAPFLLASLGSTAVRDALVVQICLGLDAAYGGAHGCGLLTGREAGGGFPGSGRPELPEWRPARSPRSYGRDFARVLTGDTSAPPVWARVDAAATLLGGLYSGGEGTARAACGTVLAWLEWARARGSRAQAMIGAVLAECLGYRLAVLLERLLATGKLPEWSFDPATAWPGTGLRAV
ncbi:DUF4192 family protein [Arthrobacter deserti]|uniref:DUF4192 family protein n=1 Tax=Arthrobacter deserti TaxID=1742687 RepID=A0ABX1JJH5_9MICC|nr:DUF4192 family protein [Arthrobacter deserti]